MSTSDTEPKPKSKEIRILGFVIVVLVCLYVALTFYVMRTNQTIGSTQLDYSALHTTQLKQLTDQGLHLDDKLARLRDGQENFAAVMSLRLNRLESQTTLISNALMMAGSTEQTFANATGAQLDGLHKQLVASSNALAAAIQDQSRATAALAAPITDLQNRLTAVTTALAAIDRQQGALAAALTPQITQLQKDLADMAAAHARWEETQLMSRQLDRLLAKTKATDQVNENNLAGTALLWQQARLAEETARPDPQWADKVNQLTTETTRLQASLANAVSAAVTKLHRAAANAGTTEERQAAWTKAGETLVLYPLAADPALAAQAQKLFADHESIRQQLAAPSAPPKK